MKTESSIYQSILEGLPIGVYFVDPDRRILYWNQGAEAITGFSAEELVGTRCPDGLLRHINHLGEDLCSQGCPLNDSLQTRQPNAGELFLHHKEGQRIPVSVRINPLFDEEGVCIGAVEIFQDNTPQHAILERISELQQQVYLDPLTGLANRRYAEQQLENAVVEMERLNWSFGVITLDIDDFKRINDTYGHEVGDKVLKMVAGTLRSGSRSFDVLSRWGGEEFLCISVNINAAQLADMTERLRMLVEKSFYMEDAEPIRVTISAGAAMHQPGESVESLLRRADQLLYTSKSEGKNRISLQTSI